MIGVKVAPSSVWGTPRRHGTGPAPRRSGLAWAQLVRAQAAALPACGPLTVGAVLLQRLCVLFFIEVGTRRAYLSGVTANPVGEWVTQPARNLSVLVPERSRAFKYLVRDRDTKFTTSFDEVLGSDGTKVIETPVRSPRANALAERFVGTARGGCLERLLIFDRRHLEQVPTEHIGHYNEHRPRRSLGQLSPQQDTRPAPVTLVGPGRLRRHDRLGGLVNEYELAA